MFETKRQRGRFLVLLLATAVVVFLGLNSWAARRANERAETTQAVMRTELPRVGARELLLPIDNDLSIPDLRSILPADDGAQATSEVRVLWQYRCVVGRIDEAGNVAVEIFERSCP